MDEIERLKKLNEKLFEENKELRGENERLTEENPRKRVKVLELKNNPVNELKWKNNSMNEKLVKENEWLISNRAVGNTTVERLEMEKHQDKLEIERLHKQLERLKDRYKKNIRRFMEIVYKILGYKIEFITEERLRITPKQKKESSIVIDIGDLKEMRLNRGKFKDLNSELVDNLVKFWILDKKEMSCFFNALSLELYEQERKE
ncbi:hypothetical protein FOA43_002973 [Brettanomyces nanus]|uniref:Spindle assembly checkpoint component MAD1 n=1 Tax=Eeniella nana TaxID=13502 RepID=A0A875S2P6_EENNA|nr:uncharacterized protein FOA43_002973 [Brettanomyces nanus]QPG75616.1 hypothetical protein FOA43_002973 [Brettanomyces nanus]